MGSATSIPQQNPSTIRLNRDNWKSLPESQISQHFLEYGSYVQLKNNMTGEQLNQYQMLIYDQNQYFQFLNVCQYRNQHDVLVKVAYLNEVKIKQYCSVGFSLQIYIEHFPIRLCDVKEISFPQNLYILQRALLGFSILYRIFGNFHITQDLICINQQGIVKVWRNSNLSKSYIQNINQSFTHCYKKNVELNNQNSMVWEILTMVQQISNYSTLKCQNKLIDYLGLLNKSQLTFIQTIQLIKRYAIQYKIQIPQMLESLIKVMRQKKGIFDSQIDIHFNFDEKKIGDKKLIGKPNFKQSKVQRIHGFQNNSGRSYVGSQSNHTFADRLKTYDRANKYKVDGFGKVVSQLKNAIPILESQVGEYQSKEPLTERLLANPLSFSSISSPQAYSLSALSPANFGIITLNNKESSQISSSPIKNPLAFSESPKQIKPLTYFSQYIQPNQPNIIKKQSKRNLCQNEKFFLSNESNSKMLGDAFVTMSLENSKNSKTDNLVYPGRPVIKFTYNTNPTKPVMDQIPQKKLQDIALQSIIQKLNNQPQQSYDESQQPISPPSVQKSSTVLNVNKISYDLVKEQNSYNRISKEPQKLLQKYLQKKEFIQNSRLKRLETIQKQQQQQQNYQQQNYYQLKQNYYQLKQNYYQLKDQNPIQSPAIVLKQIYTVKPQKSIDSQKQQQQIINQIKPLVQGNKKDQIYQNYSLISSISSNSKTQTKIYSQQLFRLKNQFDIDSQIAQDLLIYEQSTLKQKQQNMNLS